MHACVMTMMYIQVGCDCTHLVCFRDVLELGLCSLSVVWVLVLHACVRAQQAGASPSCGDRRGHMQLAHIVYAALAVAHMHHVRWVHLCGPTGPTQQEAKHSAATGCCRQHICCPPKQRDSPDATALPVSCRLHVAHRHKNMMSGPWTARVAAMCLLGNPAACRRMFLMVVHHTFLQLCVPGALVHPEQLVIVLSHAGCCSSTCNLGAAYTAATPNCGLGA